MLKSWNNISDSERVWVRFRQLYYCLKVSKPGASYVLTLYFSLYLMYIIYLAHIQPHHHK